MRYSNLCWMPRFSGQSWIWVWITRHARMTSHSRSWLNWETLVRLWVKDPSTSFGTRDSSIRGTSCNNYRQESIHFLCVVAALCDRPRDARLRIHHLHAHHVALMYAFFIYSRGLSRSIILPEFCGRPLWERKNNKKKQRERETAYSCARLDSKNAASHLILQAVKLNPIPRYI